MSNLAQTAQNAMISFSSSNAATCPPLLLQLLPAAGFCYCCQAVHPLPMLLPPPPRGAISQLAKGVFLGDFQNLFWKQQLWHIF
jgi:hypothetical protein